MGIEFTTPNSPSTTGYIPEDYGVKAWSMDPLIATASQLLTAQQVLAARIPIRETFTCTKVVTFLLTAGAGLTYAAAGIFNESLEQVAITGSLTTAWASGGYVRSDLTTPVELVGGEGRYCFVALLTNGTTQPTFMRAVAGAGTYHVGLNDSTTFGATKPRGGTQNGQASMPATLSLSSGAGVPYVALA